MIIDKETTVTVGELGLCLGIKKSQISELELADVIKKTGRNKYLLVDSLHGYREFLRKGSPTKDESGSVIDFNIERARKTKEEADKLERENRLADNNVLDQEEHGLLLTEALLVQKRELESMELQLSHLLPGMSNAVRDEIKRISARCHNAVLDLQIDQESDELAKA